MHEKGCPSLFFSSFFTRQTCPGIAAPEGYQQSPWEWHGICSRGRQGQGQLQQTEHMQPKGADQLHWRVLRELSDIILERDVIFERSLHSGQLPDDSKRKTTITLIFRRGKQSDSSQIASSWPLGTLWSKSSGMPLLVTWKARRWRESSKRKSCPTNPTDELHGPWRNKRCCTSWL